MLAGASGVGCNQDVQVPPFYEAGGSCYWNVYTDGTGDNVTFAVSCSVGFWGNDGYTSMSRSGGGGGHLVINSTSGAALSNTFTTFDHGTDGLDWGGMSAAIQECNNKNSLTVNGGSGGTASVWYSRPATAKESYQRYGAGVTFTNEFLSSTHAAAMYNPGMVMANTARQCGGCDCLRNPVLAAPYNAWWMWLQCGM